MLTVKRLSLIVSATQEVAEGAVNRPLRVTLVSEDSLTPFLKYPPRRRTRKLTSRKMEQTRSAARIACPSAVELAQVAVVQVD